MFLMRNQYQPYRKDERNVAAFDEWWEGATFVALAKKHGVSAPVMQKIVYREARRRGLPTHKQLQEMRKAKNVMIIRHGQEGT